MTTPDTVGGLQLEIYKRLARLQIGTCRCDVKTPVLEYHETSCTYRVAVEINGLVDELCRAAPAGGDVERFSPDCEPCSDFESWVGCMRPDPNGNWVRAAPAGGDDLRLLVKELRESLEGVVRVADRQTDEFDRAREAIARAAHVFVNAGDSEAQFIADGRDLNCPACGGSGHVDDSAPAGSGEVELGGWLWGKLMDFCKGRRFHPAEFNDLFAIVSELRALLRKLQQGADYVVVGYTLPLSDGSLSELAATFDTDHQFKRKIAVPLYAHVSSQDQDGGNG